MHTSALRFGKLFFDTYVSQDDSIILDIGSQDVNGSLRTVAPLKNQYIGLDFVAGKGVDIILTDPYILPFEDDSLDIIVSSSCFEHSEFFWILFNEILRVLRPGGLLYINAPSNGVFHRYPVDCWRFYPDSGIAMQNWGRRSGFKVSLMESFTGMQINEGWNDFVAVFIKSDVSNSPYKKRMLDSIADFRNGFRDGVSEAIHFYESNQDQERIKKLDQSYQTLDQSYQTLDQSYQALKRSYDSIIESRSWRFTKPLRLISKALRNSSGN